MIHLFSIMKAFLLKRVLLTDKIWLKIKIDPVGWRLFFHPCYRGSILTPYRMGLPNFPPPYNVIFNIWEIHVRFIITFLLHRVYVILQMVKFTVYFVNESLVVV